ncbi:MAG: glycerol kinase GlpK [Oscillospiraceae bacterium]|nr:glycerol kinase GlpK [Oscillospiraceae bacterium]
MEKRYLLALDQGTTSSRAVLFDRDLSIVGISQREFNQYYPQSGWVEHDADEIWGTQYGVLAEVLRTTGTRAEEVAAIGITNQRETTILWDKNTGRPVAKAIVWQCRRTSDFCEELERQGLTDEIKERTGLLLDAYFSATKIRWLLDNTPGLRERAERGEILFGTVDCWLVYCLTRGMVHVTDHTNASRTLLYNINTHTWDDRLLEIFNVPRCMLPEICDSSAVVGTMEIDGVSIPIAGIAGDQQAALFGQCCFDPGEAKNTYGTGCFLLMNTGKDLPKSENGLLTTVACSIDGEITYALEGSIFIGGAVVQWVRDELGLIRTAAESEDLAKAVEDCNGVYLVPAFTGLGAPHWDMRARGTICGLSRGANKNHLVRAALESIAYQTSDVLSAMERDTGLPLVSLKVDGGASKNNFLMQFQSDVIGKCVVRPAIVESTAMGAAMLAGLAVGVWENKNALRSLMQTDRVFAPEITKDRREALLTGWNDAIKRTCLK